MPKFSCEDLSVAIKAYILTSGWEPDNTLVRISAGSEQERVLLYGTSRAAKSDMLWDKLSLFKPEDLPRYPLRHDDVVIASRLEDIMEDAKLPDGTLAHKLEIYEKPFITFYDRSAFSELMSENTINDSRNRGRHWLFNGDKRQALLGVADIFMDGAALPLRMVPLSGKAVPRMEGRPRRFYFALTNLCNRACELCCCHSDPSRSTHLSMDRFQEIITCGAAYEAQLEGGEPLLHPHFNAMVSTLTSDPHCVRIILCSNTVLLPWGAPNASEKDTVARLQQWLQPFQAKPFLLKPSINSHLIERDPRHIEKMRLLHTAFEEMNWPQGSAMQFNVRRRPDTPDGDRWITSALEKAGLSGIANDFVYQRIGRAENEEHLARPYIIPDHVEFSLFSPDGRDFGFNLVARANHMKLLP